MITTAPSIVTKSSLNYHAQSFTSSALFGVPLVSGGPVPTFEPFVKTSGPALYGALPISVTTTTPYKIPQPIQTGQALYGASYIKSFPELYRSATVLFRAGDVCCTAFFRAGGI